MDSCPKELEPYDKAHKMKIEEQDSLQYKWWGNYGISALIVAIDRLTEEEIQKQRELFVAKLQVMQTNFELSKKGQ